MITLTSFSFSRITKSGLLFDVVKSVNGNGNKTILPFICISQLYLDLYKYRVPFLRILLENVQKALLIL